VDDDRCTVSLRVNGVSVTKEVEARLLLVDLLRDDLGLAGTHVGCDEGICGACTVNVNGEVIKSCLMFAVQAHEAEITTVEGVAGGPDFGPVQQAFAAEHALQCGYCTPGMVMSACALLREDSDPSDDEIRRMMVGNLCRCTGYQSIVAAVRTAARNARDAAAERTNG
jgi:carbon-monoxide dehydrogenase small subunit